MLSIPLRRNLLADVHVVPPADVEVGAEDRADLGLGRHREVVHLQVRVEADPDAVADHHRATGKAADVLGHAAGAGEDRAVVSGAEAETEVGLPEGTDERRDGPEAESAAHAADLRRQVGLEVEGELGDFGIPQVPRRPHTRDHPAGGRVVHRGVRLGDGDVAADVDQRVEARGDDGGGVGHHRRRVLQRRDPTTEFGVVVAGAALQDDHPRLQGVEVRLVGLPGQRRLEGGDLAVDGGELGLQRRDPRREGCEVHTLGRRVGRGRGRLLRRRQEATGLRQVGLDLLLVRQVAAEHVGNLLVGEGGGLLVAREGGGGEAEGGHEEQSHVEAPGLGSARTRTP